SAVLVELVPAAVVTVTSTVLPVVPAGVLNTWMTLSSKANKLHGAVPGPPPGPQGPPPVTGGTDAMTPERASGALPDSTAVPDRCVETRPGPGWRVRDPCPGRDVSVC